jgi:hypothetical protein
MNQQAMRESYVGKRVELPDRGMLACPYCGSHLICYNVVSYSRQDRRGRDAEVEHITGACLRCSGNGCHYASVLPLGVKTAMSLKLHPALPEQLEAVRAWLAVW